MALTDLLLSSDTPLDKIVGYQTGSLLIGTSGFDEVLVPHDLGFSPLPKGKWSTDPTFELSFDPMSNLAPARVGVRIRANATNLNVRGINFTSSPITIYYRVNYFMPTDIDVPAEWTQTGLDSFNVNSDYNYSKLFDADVSIHANDTIAHNLSYFPQTEVWWQDSSGWNEPIVEDLFGDNPRAYIRTNELVLNSGTTTTVSKWHYRIYLESL